MRQAFRSVSVVTLPVLHPDARNRAVHFSEASEQFSGAVKGLRALISAKLSRPLAFAGQPQPPTRGAFEQALRTMVKAVNDNAQVIEPPIALEALLIERQVTGRRSV